MVHVAPELDWLAILVLQNGSGRVRLPDVCLVTFLVRDGWRLNEAIGVLLHWMTLLDCAWTQLFICCEGLIGAAALVLEV